MGAAQDAFASVCPISYSEYCSAPWQVTIDVCCGLCPSPAINAYGTVAGLCIASFFAMLIVLFQPAQSAWYISAQLALAHMYLVAIMARNMMSTASDGVNAIQRWHAEFAFLLASSITGTIIACVLSDTHHIHGFNSADEHEAFLDASAEHANHQGTNPSGEKRYASHPLHLQPSDEYVRGEYRSNLARAAQRLRKWGHRHQAVLLLTAFATSELYWFILYAVTIWWPARSASTTPVFWQSACDDMIGTANYRLIEGVSWTFVSLAFLATGLLCIPVFGHRTDSAAHVIVRVLSLHRETRKTAFSPRQSRKTSAHGPAHDQALATHAGLHQEAQLVASLGKKAPTAGRKDSKSGFEWDASAETWVKVCAALFVWIFWLVMVLVILFRALNDFLLVGTAWPYAAIQNLIFGFFAAIKFVLGVVRERARRITKARKAKTLRKSEDSSPVTTSRNGARRKAATPSTPSSPSRRSRLGLSRGRGSERASPPPRFTVSAPSDPAISAAARRYGRVTEEHIKALRTKQERLGTSADQRASTAREEC